MENNSGLVVMFPDQPGKFRAPGRPVILSVYRLEKLTSGLCQFLSGLGIARVSVPSNTAICGLVQDYN